MTGSNLLSVVEKTAPREILRAVGVCKRYGGVQALDNVEIVIHQGEIHGIIGQNGAGKSTLVKIMAGIERPDTGTMTLNGAPVAFSKPHEAQALGIILMPQELALLPGASLADNIVLGSEPQRLGLYNRKEAERRARKALNAVGLSFAPQTMATELSTAHRRLLTLARAMDRNACVLILDEPTAGLAPREAEIIKSTVRALKAQGVTIVYISHDMTELAELCDQVTCLRGGKVIATLGMSENGNTGITKNAMVELILGKTLDGLVDAAVSRPRKPSSESGELDPRLRSPRGPITSRSDGCLIEGKNLQGSQIEGVSFTAEPNSILGITGLVGSGVTELIGMIAGSVQPDKGEISINGHITRFGSPADALKEGVGYLAGDRTIAAFSAMSVRQNVSISALQKWFGMLGLISANREARETQGALDALSVTANPKLRISQLSGGNQQRALVGRLIASSARCMIFDDPTVGVDISARAILWEAVRKLSTTRTIVVASSEAEELVALCDRVICLKRGKVSNILEGREISTEAITHAVT